MSDAISPVSWSPPAEFVHAQRSLYFRRELLPMIRGSLIGIMICGGVFFFASPLLPDLPWRFWLALIAMPLILIAASLAEWWRWKSPVITLNSTGICMRGRTLSWQAIVAWQVIPAPANPACQALQLSVRGRMNPLLFPLPGQTEATHVLRIVQQQLGPAAVEYALRGPDLSGRSMLLLCLLSLAYAAGLAIPLSSHVWVTHPHIALAGLIGLGTLIVGPGTPWALLTLRAGRGRAGDIVFCGTYVNFMSNVLAYVLAMILHLRQSMP